ncbi:MAG: MlaD family protein, partial [Gammaproteobacteria bacterium]|nr:MlaD family protein [Gammaproteobacteria bacterium]
MNPKKIAEPMIDSTAHHQRLSLVWLVPIVAALLGLGLAYQHFTQLGPRITLTFESAQGLKAGKTEIKYRDVSVGKVEKVFLDKGLERVRVVARMVVGFDEYLTENSRFWVKRPRVGAGGISGLSTLVSGAYIQVDPVKEGDYREFFHGLEEPPLRRNNAAGLRLAVSAEQAGSVQVGSPVYYRQVQVGQVEARRFSDDYQQVEFDLFIEAPHHRLITPNSRFWNVSGLEVTLDSSGVRVQMESLESLAYGGIAFAELGQQTTDKKVINGEHFKLFANREAAATETNNTQSEPSVIDGLQQQLDKLLNKFNDLPLEPLLKTSTETLRTLGVTLKEMQLPKLSS